MAVNTGREYKLGPVSMAQDGVPKGVIKGPFQLSSEAYPGTLREDSDYVPAQDDPAVPSALMIWQDGPAGASSGAIAAFTVASAQAAGTTSIATGSTKTCGG